MPNLPRHAEPAPKRASPARGSSRAKLKGEAQPFLKWAGGKAQLLEQFEPFFPDAVRSYCEPFLGGGAVFFHLNARYPKMKAVLRDNNPELFREFMSTHWIYASLIEGAGCFLYLKTKKPNGL